MRPRKLVEPATRSEWMDLATDRLESILKAVRGFPILKKLGPKTMNGKTWIVEVQLVGKVLMSKVNFNYRRKNYPTDVLSFPAPDLFVKQGILGELIVCLPVLKAQAKEMKISSLNELDVLLVHGVLHLLGFDHEKSPKEASKMALWESRILNRVQARTQAKTKLNGRLLGLIDRSNSDKEST